MKMRWLLVLGLIFTALTAHASPVFTDTEAKRFFDRRINEGCSLAIRLGTVLLQVGEKKDENFPEEIRQRALRGEDWGHVWGPIALFMYAMEERGVIEIERLWADANQKWQEARVTLTPRGEAIGERRAEEVTGSDFCLKWGSGRVTHIVRNEEVRKGLDVFRVVMAVYEIEWIPEQLLLAEMVHGVAPSGQRKLTGLLKYDPFQSKWEFVTGDVANLDGDFTTNRVATELERR